MTIGRSAESPRASSADAMRRLQSSSYNALVPEIKAPPEHGAAIWVFELPKKRR